MLQQVILKGIANIVIDPHRSQVSAVSRIQAPMVDVRERPLQWRQGPSKASVMLANDVRGDELRRNAFVAASDGITVGFHVPAAPAG